MKLATMPIVYLFYFLLATISLSCNKEKEEFPQNSLEKLEAQREKWEDFKMTAYHIDQQLSCFCIQELTANFRVKVENNTIVAVDDNPIQPDLHAHLMTIDATFDYVASKIKSKPDHIEISYDATYGFISSFYVDQSEMIADEEQGYTFSNFTPSN
jgi:hypothetical protein